MLGLLLISAAQSSVTFGTAYKGTFNGKPWATGVETEVYNYTCAAAPCLMHHMWVGGNFPGYELSAVSYYVDGAATPSVVLPLGMGHGMGDAGKVDDDGPWAAGALFGKTGSPSGIFNTYAIPFGKSIRVSVFLHGAVGKTTAFWIILRGRTVSPVRIGGEMLPVAARLRSFHHVKVPVASGGYLQTFNSSKHGALLQTTLSVDSSKGGGGGETFLEGCFRAMLGNKLAYHMSSGTEDYFLGTYYFNKGKYANPVAGLTKLSKNESEGDHINPRAGGTAKFSAYRLHTSDLIFWEAGETFSQTWRDGDTAGCDESQKPGAPAVTASSFSLVYEW